MQCELKRTTAQKVLDKHIRTMFEYFHYKIWTCYPYEWYISNSSFKPIIILEQETKTRDKKYKLKHS